MEKNALITGSGIRIGRAIALKLAQEGWNIALHYNHSLNETLQLQNDIQALGRKAIIIQGDLEDSTCTQTIFQQAKAQLGIISSLINNASVFDQDDIKTLTDTSFTRHMMVNLLAPTLLSQLFAAQTDLTANHNGSIINIIDQRIHNLHADFMSYTLSKSALWTLTQMSAMSLAPEIRVNAIGPGPTLQSKRQSPDQFMRQCQQLPLRKGPAPEEIANGVFFLINSPSITGEFISMDGGQHLPSSAVDEKE